MKTFSLLIGSLSAQQAMNQALNDMQDYFHPGTSPYDPNYVSKNLTECINKYGDDILMASQDNAWQQFYGYWASNGTDSDYMNHTDHWGQCQQGSPYDDRCTVPPYMMRTPAPFGKDGVLIEEPCNYASNIAFFHSATRVCDYPEWSLDEEYQNAIKRGFITLGFGSAMWHGSHTFVGFSFDNKLMSILAYLAHQGSVQNLPTNSTVVKELSLTPRKGNSRTVTTELVENLKTHSPPDWAKFVNTMDIERDYYIVYAAFLGTVFSLILPFQFMANWAITQLTTAALDPESAEFMNEHYMPELGDALKTVSLSKDQKSDLFNKFIGMFMKMGWSFVFQEHVLPLPKLYTSVPMHIAAWLTPHFNALASRISGLPQTDQNVIDSKNVYPGDDYCRSFSPHAIWHEESASGSLELIFVADAINKLLIK